MSNKDQNLDTLVTMDGTNPLPSPPPSTSPEALASTTTTTPTVNQQASDLPKTTAPPPSTTAEQKTEQKTEVKGEDAKAKTFDLEAAQGRAAAMDATIELDTSPKNDSQAVEGGTDEDEDDEEDEKAVRLASKQSKPQPGNVVRYLFIKDGHKTSIEHFPDGNLQIKLHDLTKQSIDNAVLAVKAAGIDNIVLKGDVTKVTAEQFTQIVDACKKNGIELHCDNLPEHLQKHEHLLATTALNKPVEEKGQEANKDAAPKNDPKAAPEAANNANNNAPKSPAPTPAPGKSALKKDDKKADGPQKRVSWIDKANQSLKEARQSYNEVCNSLKNMLHSTHPNRFGGKPNNGDPLKPGGFGNKEESVENIKGVGKGK